MRTTTRRASLATLIIMTAIFAVVFIPLALLTGNYFLASGALPLFIITLISIGQRR